MQSVIPALQKGDLIDLVAPASKSAMAAVRKSAVNLKAMGFRVRTPKNLFGSSRLFANSDAVRLQQLAAALQATDSKLVWCMRGGYGGLRLLPGLDKMAKPKYQKIFIGYSDITSIHTFLTEEWDWATFHGPNFERLGRETFSVKDRKLLRQVLEGATSSVCFGGLKALNSSAKRPAVRRGRIVGGNMAVLQSGLGTPWALKPKAKDIVFFEDLGEQPRRVDRMLEQMRQCGWFERVAAVIFGEILNSLPSERRLIWNDVIPRFAEQLSIPVLCGLKVGHSDRGQHVLPLNTRAELFLGPAPSLSVTTGIGT